MEGFFKNIKEEESHLGVAGVQSGDIPQYLADSCLPSTACPENAMRQHHACTYSAINMRKRKESRYMSSECDVQLCWGPCFKQ
jgi:hypothetical protein